jgi:hypothetical protein
VDESRRFLRYVVPGAVYGVLTTLWLSIVLPDWVIPKLASLANLGTALAGVITSGALGCIFATAHHWCHWHVPWYKNVFDHSGMVNSLLEKQKILSLPKGSKVDRKRADVIVTTLWCQRTKEGGSVGPEAEKRVSAQTDLTHALGAICVASFVAFVSTLIVCWCFGTFSRNPWDLIRFVSMLVLAIIVICLFLVSYRRVGDFAKGICQETLNDALEKERKEEDKEQPAATPP